MSDTPDNAAQWAAAEPDLPPFPRTERPAPAAPPPVEYVGVFTRGVALVVDVVVLALFSVPLFFAGSAGVLAGFAVLDLPAPIATEDTLASLVSSGWTMMAFLYFTLLHRGTGQTIGKAAVGIRVRSQDLEPIGLGRSLVRTLGYLLSLSLLGIGFLIAAVMPRKRAWHDYIAGTCVVRTVPEEA